MGRNTIVKTNENTKMCTSAYNKRQIFTAGCYEFMLCRLGYFTYNLIAICGNVMNRWRDDIKSNENVISELARLGYVYSPDLNYFVHKEKPAKFGEVAFIVKRSEAQFAKTTGKHPRNANGQFLPKVEVAEFIYNSNGETNHRMVVIDKSRTNEHVLNGFDIFRMGYRSFRRANIAGLSKSKRYFDKNTGRLI